MSKFTHNQNTLVATGYDSDLEDILDELLADLTDDENTPNALDESKNKTTLTFDNSLEQAMQLIKQVDARQKDKFFGFI